MIGCVLTGLYEDILDLPRRDFRSVVNVLAPEGTEDVPPGKVGAPGVSSAEDGAHFEADRAVPLLVEGTGPVVQGRHGLVETYECHGERSECRLRRRGEPTGGSKDEQGHLFLVLSYI